MARQATIITVAALLMAATAAGQGFQPCPSGMRLVISTRKPPNGRKATRTASAPASPVEEVTVKAGQKLKAYVTLSNANASETVLDASVGLHLGDGVSYFKTISQSSKALPLPVTHDSQLMWLSIGRLAAASGTAPAQATFGVALELGECLPDTVEVPVSAVVMLGNNQTTCDLVGSHLVLRRKASRKEGKAPRCTRPPPLDNLGGLCTSSSACGQGLVCRHGRCSVPLMAVNDPCTVDSTCGPGNNCINGFCQYCARLGQGCHPPDACPGESSRCGFSSYTDCMYNFNAHQRIVVCLTDTGT